MCVYIFILIKETQDLVFPVCHSFAVTLESRCFFALSFVNYKGIVNCRIVNIMSYCN